MIESDPATLSWRLDVGEASYALGYRDGSLLHLGFGPPAGEWWRALEETVSRLREAWGDRVSEVFYSVDGVERWDELDLIGSEVEETDGARTLTVRLRDRRLGIEVSLWYRPRPELAIVERSQSLTNVGAEPVALTELPAFHLRAAGAFRLVSLYGTGNDQCLVQSTELPVGTTVLESRTGKTGHEHAPWFTVEGDRGGLFGELSYSGNWRIGFSRDPFDGVTVTGGVNPWRFRHVLRPGETVSSPTAVLGFTRGDGNAVGRALHRYQRRWAIPASPRPLPVQFNTWYPSRGVTPGPWLRTMIDRAADLGCEVFVLDAGWYRNRTAAPDADWAAQLGDWETNVDLIPEGVSGLADHVRAKGLTFGIWMEPEVVTPSSRVFREHPEWIHSRDGRPIVLGGRHTLRLGREDAWAWVHSQVVRVVRETGAGWLKWDFNTDLREGGEDPDGRDALLEHVEGLYRLWDAVREEFPDLVLEGCAGGGGRLNLGSIAHTHVTWMTDMVSPVNALGIRFGSSHAYAAGVLNNFVSEWPPDWPWWPGAPPGRGDLDFRTRVAMMGAFGVSAPIDTWSAGDLARLASHVETYKSLRTLIGGGDLYRLTEDPRRDGSGGWAAMAFVDPGGAEAALFAFRLGSGGASERFRIPGLDAGSVFELEGDGVPPRRGLDAEALGIGGVEVRLEEPFTSTLLRIRATDGT